MLKPQGAKQDRETSFYSFPILVTTPWTASVFNKLPVSLRTELNPQRQFTELLTRDLPDLTPGSPELQLQTHTEGNTVSSAQTHTHTHRKHKTLHIQWRVWLFFPSIHLETDLFHLIWNSVSQSVHVFSLWVSWERLRVEIWELLSEIKNTSKGSSASVGTLLPPLW